jgi:hypothetical protein
MEHIITIQQGLLDWLRGQVFDPAIRSFDTANQPVAIYPQASLSLAEEVFWPGQSDTTARLNLDLRVAAGRFRDTQSTLASLAHQVRRALATSHDIGGLVKHFIVERIAYQRVDSETVCPVIGQAILYLITRYVVREL